MEADARFTAAPLTSPQVFSVSGAGDAFGQNWATQRVSNPTLPMPGRLNLWMFGTGFNQVQVMVRITGQRAPKPAWASRQSQTAETIQLTRFGAARSKFAWAEITEIQISGLPIGVTLSGQVGTFNATYVQDNARPYTDAHARDVLFDRYWTYQDGMLREQYLSSNHSGFRYIQSYATGPVNGIAVEPNTYGLWVAQGTTLSYVDRREPLPTSLGATALSTEPYFGVKVSIDETQVGPLRSVVLEPIPYALSGQVTQYRYLLQTPDGTTYALTPDGIFATFTPIAGWRRMGTPYRFTSLKEVPRRSRLILQKTQHQKRTVLSSLTLPAPKAI